MLKKIIKVALKLFGKRITNYYAPAKPYAEGVLFLKTLIQEPAWIIDIGVASGTPEIYEIFSMEKYKYLLVEADPRFKSELRRLQQKNQNNVFIETVFCGEQPGTTDFYTNNEGRSSSKYSNNGTTGSITVPVTTLDTLIQKHNIEGNIFLKIDVEGAEIDVLKGAVATLKKCDVVILESWINPGEGIETPSDFATLVDFMQQHSFVVFDFFGGHSYETGVLKMVDVVFVKKDSPYRQQQQRTDKTL